MRLAFRIPVRAIAGLNARLNPFARANKVKSERRKTKDAWVAAGGMLASELTWDDERRWLVKLVRIGPNPLDDDNLVGTLKAVRDELAAQLGYDDRDRRVRFVYDQRQEGFVTFRDPKSRRKSKKGIYAVEAFVAIQRCPDCFVDHCECIHDEQLCASCQEAA